MKPWSLSKVEARELSDRDERMSRGGGVRHEHVVAKMLEDMDRELRAMVQAYSPGDNKTLAEIMDCAAVADREGLDVSEPLRALLDKIAGAHPRAA